MQNTDELRMLALLELTKAIVSLNKAQQSLQMEILEIQYKKWPEQSVALLFTLFFGFLSMLSLGFSVAALGISLSITWIQNLGWAVAFLCVIAQVLLLSRYKRLRTEWQERDKKIIKVRQLFEKLQEIKIDF